MSLTLTMTTALSGLQTAQKGLDVVSNNLVNVNTPGYTRKSFMPESVVLNGRGSGVQTGGIVRSINENLNKDVRTESSRLAYYSTTDSYYDRLQNLLGKPADNTSISHQITSLATQIENLALEPDQSTQQLSVVQAAQTLAGKFNTLTRQLQDMRLSADQDIAQAVTEVNAHLKNIDALNDQISQGIATNRDVTTLRDQRDQELQSLNELIEVTSFERNGGALVIYTKGGVNLLDVNPVELSHTSLTSVEAFDSYAGADFGTVGVGTMDITADLTGGKLGALIEMRDKVIPNTQSQLDELAATLRDTLNQIHNQGTGYPNPNTQLQGTTQFIAPASQTMTLQSGDTAIVIFNQDGSQKASTTLSSLLGTGPFTLNAMATAVETWMNGVTGASGTFDYDTGSQTFSLNLNANSYSLAFRDQASSTAGSTAGDATIAFDSNGDGRTDQTIKGFSNFLGLNDLFVSPGQQWMVDSAVQSQTWTPGVPGALSFSVAGADPATDPPTVLGSLTVQPNWTIKDIANAINSSTTLSRSLEAEVVPDGDGVRLRIKNKAGDTMEVTGGASMLNQLGLAPSHAGQSKLLTVNPSLVTDPARISRAAVSFNADTGEYLVSEGDNTVANKLAAAFKTTVAFSNAGGLVAGNRTLSDYAALSLSQSANHAATVSTNLSYQTQLTATLTTKQAEVSGVNMDEEIAQLLVWEQMYNAAAKVISVTSDMLDVLNSIIR